MNDNNAQIAAFFDGLAPSWDDNERSTAEDLRHFLKPLNIKKGDKILDIACGTGIITPLLQERSKSPVIGVDISSKMIELAKAKYASNPSLIFENEDFYTFNGRDFDWIICFNAYPHFIDKDAFIRKLYFTLSHNGCFAICHNTSRCRLEAHHQGEVVSSLSRHLLPIMEEIKGFTPYFDIIYAREDETSYWIVGRKKS